MRTDKHRVIDPGATHAEEGTTRLHHRIHSRVQHGGEGNHRAGESGLHHASSGHRDTPHWHVPNTGERAG